MQQDKHVSNWDRQLCVQTTGVLTLTGFFVTLLSVGTPAESLGLEMLGGLGRLPVTFLPASTTAAENPPGLGRFACAPPRHSAAAHHGAKCITLLDVQSLPCAWQMGNTELLVKVLRLTELLEDS